MLNATFVVWRESVEAILVVGILYAWLSRGEQRLHALPWLWVGVAAGAVLALALGGVLLFVQSGLAGETLELFQAGMVLFAAGLITQMVLWMHRHGRRLKTELEQQADNAVSHARWWGVALLAAIAVGREGAETVLFLYGLALEHTGIVLSQWLAAAGLGFAAAGVTAWLLNRGSRMLSWRAFFRTTEILLLLLAVSLLVGGVEKLMALDVLPMQAEPLWNTRPLLDDGRGFGGVLAVFAGYRAEPTPLLVAIWASYWMTVAVFMRFYAAAPVRAASAA